MVITIKAYRFSFVAGVALLSTGALAEKDYHPGVIGADDRVRVLGRPGPWQAVGQVNGSGYRKITRCTGTLVAKNIVVTAAHCLTDYRRVPVPNHQIHFLAGPPGTALKNHSIARCVRFHPDYPLGNPPEKQSGPPEKATMRDVAHDVAVIVLDQDIALEPAPTAQDLVVDGDLDLVHAAYPMDHRYALTAHFNCSLKKVEDGPLWRTECDTHPASSGGPVFVSKGDKLELAAVMVGAVRHQASLAVPISDWADLISGDSCPPR